MNDDPSITVFHLVWAPYGITHLQRFLDSYRAHRAGVTHRLHFLFNGFTSDDEIELFRRLVGEIPHDLTVIDRPVQDIEAYSRAARNSTATFVCFLNSYACILADQWLAIMHRHMNRAAVGLVGATGSYESRYTETLRCHVKSELQLGRNILKWPTRYKTYKAARSLERRRIRLVQTDYLAFPNPHLRTNGFMIRREVMVGLTIGNMVDKEAAYRFESGRNSMTRQVTKAGLDVLVVGRDGLSYPSGEWPHSQTFRVGNQTNLLISDNQTRIYDASSPQDRRSLIVGSWGRDQLLKEWPEGVR